MVRKKKGVSSQLGKINSVLKRIEKKEDKIEKEEKVLEKKIGKISKEEESIQRTILRLGKVSIRKKHVLDFISASAGAFLGVGIGRGLIGLDSVAKNLSWFNILGILAFIWAISALLIYKDAKVEIKSRGSRVVFERLIFIYCISLLIEFISLLLFNVQYDSVGTLIKILIVGSYTAMASAITFSIIK